MSIDRYASPDAKRIVLIDRVTGDVWVMRRQNDREVAFLMTQITSWERLPPRETVGRDDVRTVEAESDEEAARRLLDSLEEEDDDGKSF